MGQVKSTDEQVVHLSNRVVLDNSSVCRAGVVVALDGSIERILVDDELDELVVSKYYIIDHGDLVLMAGLVDAHVHINEPGRTHWEGFTSGTRAAALGGVTTIVDMPLNSLPPTTTVHNLEKKKDAAEGKCYVDVAFWGGLVPDNIDDLDGLVREGVVGFKCFLTDSGVPEFPAVTMEQADEALAKLCKTGCPLAFHAEFQDSSNLCEMPGNPHEYNTFLATRPPKMEVRAVKLIADLCEKHRSPCHVVHVSSAECLDVLSSARARGVPLSAETCPHYLSLAAETVPRGATHFKCCPPIRSAANKERLWSGLLRREIQLIASDHSPYPRELREKGCGNFLEAWGGISSLQLGLPVVWTEGRTRGMQLGDIYQLMSHAPALLCGLGHRKGCLAPGYDADLIVWDPDEQFQVDENTIEHRHKLSPYLDHLLYGKVRCTILRGQIVMQEGQFSQCIRGELLRAHH